MGVRPPGLRATMKGLLRVIVARRFRPQPALTAASACSFPMPSPPLDVPGLVAHQHMWQLS